MSLIDDLRAAQRKDETLPTDAALRREIMRDVSGDLAELLEEESSLIIAPPPPKIIPAVGIHENIPESVYHRQWDAVSNSRLTILYNRTALHLREAIDNPPPDTPATIMGRAIHSAILTPGEFTQYVRGPEHDRRSNKNKEAWLKLEAQHGKEYVLKPAVYDHVMAVRRVVQARPFIMALLTGGGHKSELSIVWRDEATGLLCKARLDHISPDIETPEGKGAIVDLKSTEDASEDAFIASIYNYGYHRQAATYLDGAFANGIEVAHYVWIAVEKKPPYGTAIYMANAGMLAAGKASVELLMKRYARCVQRDEWPGYPEEVVEVGLPPWALKKIEDETRGAK